VRARRSARSSLTKTYMEVGNAEPIHMSEKSPFRRCGRDLVEFFNNTGWASYVQEEPDTVQFSSKVYDLFSSQRICVFL
jgi:hypothetical protein